MSDDVLAKFEKMQAGIAAKKLEQANIENDFTNLDTTMNFKVNNLLKKEFERICKAEYSNPSREIKLFMLKTIKQGRL